MIMFLFSVTDGGAGGEVVLWVAIWKGSEELPFRFDLQAMLPISDALN